MLDEATVQLLQDLPADLQARGWRLVVAESGVLRWGTNPRDYKAVYVRPFDPGIDDETRASVLFRNGQPVVRVSTNQLHSPNWDAAYQDAIRLMRAVDGRRNDAA